MSQSITKLTIKGFKSIRELVDFELRDLNVIIGANGSGKSNFISFFTLLRSMVRQELGHAVATIGGADKILHLGQKITNAIEAHLRFGQNGYEFILTPTANDELVFAKEDTYYVYDKEPRYRHLHASGQRESRLKECKDNSGLTSQRGIEFHVHEAVSGWTVYHFHDTSATAGVRYPVTTRHYETLSSDASNLAAFLLRLKSTKPKSYEDIRDVIRMVTPFFDDFLLRPQVPVAGDSKVLLEWSQKGTDYPFHPSQLSDGTLRFMCLATALLQPNPPSTIIIDEPELGLHPYALAVLAGLIQKASTQTQVIVSTQSATLLDHFEPEDAIVVDRKAGASEFRRLSKEQLEQWLEEYSLGELWEKNVFEGGPNLE